MAHGALSHVSNPEERVRQYKQQKGRIWRTTLAGMSRLADDTRTLPKWRGVVYTRNLCKTRVNPVGKTHANTTRLVRGLWGEGEQTKTPTAQFARLIALRLIPPQNGHRSWSEKPKQYPFLIFARVVCWAGARKWNAERARRGKGLFACVLAVRSHMCDDYN